MSKVMNMLAAALLGEVTFVQNIRSKGSYSIASNDAETIGGCKPREAIPPIPKHALEYNGVSWPAYCFEGDEEEHMFIIGDWGGLDWRGQVKPAPNTKDKGGRGRWFKRGIDDRAQVLVAHQMSLRAEQTKPRLVLNGGDNFYWGGIISKCGKPMKQAVEDFSVNFSNPSAKETLQFKHVFEDMYTGDALGKVPWLSCFGNHDWGGYTFSTAWDQQIAYTWGPTKRWVFPALYWHQHVQFPSKNTTVDVYMMDTNNQDTAHPNSDPGHNICSRIHNYGSDCSMVAPGCPSNAYECVRFFDRLWKEQMKWMYEKICASTADWQIVVTHFPPEPMAHVGGRIMHQWKKLGDECGIDFFVGSHRHDQEIHHGGGAGFPYVVAGGGGGITSERNPSAYNAQYGFFDMTVTKESLHLLSINQHGRHMGEMYVKKRENAAYWRKVAEEKAQKKLEEEKARKRLAEEEAQKRLEEEEAQKKAEEEIVSAKDSTTADEQSADDDATEIASD